MESRKIKVATYNANYSRRATEPLYGAYQWEQRCEGIYELIEEIDADVLLIQEIHGDYLDAFKARLSAYQWHFVYQNSRGGICNIGIGCKHEKVMFGHYDFSHHDGGNEVVVFAQIEDTLYASIHFPMKQECRESMARCFDAALKCQSITPSWSKLVIGGDFNSFPKNYGYTEMPLMNSVCGTYSATEFAVNDSDGEYATSSFEPYPYDCVPPSGLKAVGKLDHILVKGYETLSATVYDTHLPHRNIAPSDHFPVVVELVPILEQSDPRAFTAMQ